MIVMKDRISRQESRAERSRRKAAAAKLRYAETLEEIKEYSGILLALRDRKIRKLEAEVEFLRSRCVDEHDPEELRKYQPLVYPGRPLWREAEMGSRL